MATHDSHAAAEQAAVPTDHTRLERLRETIQTCADTLDAHHADHCCPDGDWRPETLSATEKVWHYPRTDARVVLESPGFTKGWTVHLERGDESVALLEDPAPRGLAFALARDRMARHSRRSV